MKQAQFGNLAPVRQCISIPLVTNAPTGDHDTRHSQLRFLVQLDAALETDEVILMEANPQWAEPGGARGSEAELTGKRMERMSSLSTLSTS
jgi:hypothetical protein